MRELITEKEQEKKMPAILIAGYGVVGKHIKNTFTWAEIYDKYNNSKGIHETVPKMQYQFCFVTVPTPMNQDGSADTSYVEDVITEVNADIYIIKSTIPPTTTEQLIKKYNKKIIFSPEYNGATQHANVEYDFVILGGESVLTEKVAQLYQYVKTAYVTIMQVDSRTAELCKYMENTYLATKVTFCNEFYRMAKKLDINYSVLREAFCLDPRINKSHTFVYEDYPFYDSKCFNKDLPAIVKQMEKIGYKANFVQSVIDNNEHFKKGK